MPQSARRRRNRALFRKANAEIAGLASRSPERSAFFICECATLGCAELIEVPLQVYACVVEAADAYLVCAGHEDRSQEDVIVGHGGYVIACPRELARGIH